MFAEERSQEILNILNKNGKVLVKDLSVKFKVSEGMIRKDLQKLEKHGKLKRTYGGAITNRQIAEKTTISNRKIKNLNKKETISKKALTLIENNDTIFLDISSINLILAKLISKSDKKITLITNMIEIATIFDDTSNVKIICIGGIYDKKLGGIIGSEAIDAILKYRVNKAFIGSCGVNLQDNSISNFDLEEGNTKKAIISSAKVSYLLMEKEKFYYDGIYKFSHLNDIDGIICDAMPEQNICKTLKKYNVSII
ncbi:DeoR/GlpR family DNA-binding transcription regulator [Clostridium fallax]|uniref:Transcriptional regulator, DeoR family n=1 Tax=Clostridium fallax TaxID=1533 RepID=A0A1M4SFT8_9CLOT|nr:DeoR/GlpR family DNA-binding transcription regulator [Clostridium fallax]SHE31051.1 transcriptional regulator, DeoR family [Clostridium fallax]SQB07810.1 DeoR family transcriptional regulator [Clostridium fallax]